MRLTNSAFEAAKWIGVIAMSCDHAGKILIPELFAETHAIGRLAYPLFAGIIGLRLAMDPGVVSKYLRALLPWALISQPIYVLAGREWMEGNILFTLAFGVGAFAAINGFGKGRSTRGAAILAVVAILSLSVEYGPAGVVMIPALALLATTHPTRGLFAVGPLGVLANLVAEPPFLAPVDLIALLATPILLLTVPIAGRLPRLPKQAFYAYYPLHLYGLHVMDLYLR